MRRLVKLLKGELKRTDYKDKTKIVLDANNFSLEKSNFNKIEKEFNKKRYVFVDGGNANIFSNGALSIDFLRVAKVIYKKENQLKLKDVIRKDFILITKIKHKKYIVKLFDYESNKLVEEFEIDPNHPSLKYGRDLMPITSTASLIRRIIEIKEFYNENKESILVIDGNLEYKKEPIKPYMKKLFKITDENSHNLVGISKTTRLITQTDEAIQSFLKRISLKNSYILSSELKDYNLYFTNFHPRSKIFRTDIYKNNKESPETIFSSLNEISQDSSFLGYPYGLIKVDEFARITNREISLMKSFLNSFSESLTGEEDNNAHNLLDTMKF
ncbi:MAG: DNA double-strand break repair nuclease NurA [Candidatus Woesearchaeota archaeon]